ncbi:sugar efflux transporter [Usitatibacter rugosus]|uniref:Sugar efflux transporter n=1 Tax=Usitatibacter rugosus TaxID=2732067 RepID=A0A6M4GXJ7_9PROT|nr:MFS transporter [Usitatibacter rugosus]QJR11976.1 sugar efflux transporter [Usitatibacter rugosus]
METSKAGAPGAAIVALSAAAFGSGLSLRVTDPLLPRLATQFDVTLGRSADVVTFFAVAYGLSQLFFGPLGDRFGKVRVIAFACVASAVTALLCAFASSFEMLLAARLLAGITCAAVIPLAMAWIGDVVPYEQRQPVIARFLIGQILGVAMGQLFGGFAADHAHWSTPFYVLGAFFALVAAALFAVVAGLPAAARTTIAVPGNAVAHVFREFHNVVSRAWARQVLVTVFLEGLFVYGAFAFIASHLHRTYGVSLSTAGAVVMLFGAGGIGFAAFTAGFVARYGEQGLIWRGGLLAAVGLLAIAAGGGWQWAAPASALLGFGFYMLHNTLQTNATQMAPERRGAAVSSFASFFFLGQAAGAFAAGLAVERFGTGPTIAVGGAGVLVVALAFGRAKARREYHPQP